jgi:hypothetical protein
VKPFKAFFALGAMAWWESDVFADRQAIDNNIAETAEAGTKEKNRYQFIYHIHVFKYIRIKRFGKWLF